jgi:hypothetical protein
VKTTPYINQEKGATLVTVEVKRSTAKQKKKVNGDQEGCRLNLRPVPDES